jgi:hypothetical protein
LAVRAKDFSENLTNHFYDVTCFDEFLDLAKDWGFSTVLEEPHSTGIQVFRHQQFEKGNWELSSRIKYGMSPTDVRLSALPERVRIEYASAFDPAISPCKRRLSPRFKARRDSEISAAPQRVKVETKQGVEVENVTETNSHKPNDLRSKALSIATEKLSLLKRHHVELEPDHKHVPLVDQAVDSATHTIVADAIESLLRDESHSKTTFLKHEEELSLSTLPGIVPISKQLFSPNENEQPKADAAPESAALDHQTPLTLRRAEISELAKQTQRQSTPEGD